MSTEMRIGMNLPVMVPGLDRRTILEWARRIDAGPYASLAAGERINFPNPEVMVTMAAAAAVTERVRLAFTVIVLPMHSPVLIAKQVATLDVISAGRVTLGLGVGARVDDYQAVGAPFEAQRLKRMEEQIALMRRVWAGEVMVEGARPVEPLPVQPGGPEVLAGALAPQSIRRAARWADGICGFSFGPSADEVSFAYDTARRAWQQAGRTPPRLVMSFWFALGPRARAQLDDYLARYLGFLGDEAARALAPTVQTASPAALRDAARRLADLGTDELILVPTTADPDEVNRVADILA
ncbi:MAG: LLM class flavin-dependent oxidoreductase [Deltaproteobacteria bacterium]|nr:LLM class flavin-dependent oxidoreductase [Deltaproteobacteria bacterium]